MSQQFASSKDKRQRQLEQVKTINHHLRIAADQVSDGIVILEPDPVESPGPRIVYVNRGMCKLTSMRMEELLGHSLSLLFDQDKLNDFLARLPAVSEDGRLFYTHAHLTCAGGKRVRCRWTVRAVNDRYGKTLNYTVTVRREPLPEISAPKKDRQTTEAAVVVAEAVPADPNEMIDKCRLESLAIVAGGMAHDFNNLLQTMIGRFDLIRPEITRGSSMEEHFQEIEEAASSARSLTTHLLAFARGGERTRKLTDLCDIICKSKTLACIGSSVECEIDFDDEVRPSIVDETEITQVISNLIINGRQAMNNTGIIRIRAENVTVTEDMPVDAPCGDYVKISVADRGCGISKENLGNIFNPFFSTKPNGTGLGLAVTRAIVRAHEGDIAVRSQVNIGTEFWVYLPASEWSNDDADELQAFETAVAANSIRLPQAATKSEKIAGKVLVIDDQDGVRTVACALIKNLNFETDSAASGEAGIRLYKEAMHRQEPFSVVLLDMTLPGGISGEETMQELRRIDPSARIIASSGGLEKDSVIEVPATGYTGILPKPYSTEELKSALYSAIIALP